jgi:hypothetical protein
MDRWAPEIAKWRAEGIIWKEICKRTGINIRNAYLAWKRYVDATRKDDAA